MASIPSDSDMVSQSNTLNPSSERENDWTSGNFTEIESQLIELVLKYRDAVQKEQYLPVSQREFDRGKLNILYQYLSTIHQKILDSRCYCELGKLQRQLSNRFLADDTTPKQRMEMMAFVVRAMHYPIIFIAGRNALMRDFLEKKEQEKDSVQEMQTESTKEKIEEKSPEFQTCLSELENIQSLQRQIQDLFARYPKPSQWKKKLSLTQAQIASQMAAKGEIEIVIPAKSSDPENAIASIVLKES